MFTCLCVEYKNGWPKYETFENNHCSLCSYLLFPLHVVHQTKKQNTRTREAQTATSCFCLCAKSEMWHGRRKRNKNTGVFFCCAVLVAHNCFPTCFGMKVVANIFCFLKLYITVKSAPSVFFRIRKTKCLALFLEKCFKSIFFLIALIFCMLAHVVTCIFFRSFANYILSLKSDS